MAADPAKLAMPGDPDLDLDVDGITLTAVVHVGNEILIRAEGGWGRWQMPGQPEFVAEPGDPVNKVTELEMTCGWPVSPPEVIDLLAAQLETWRDRAVPLRMCAAPGRYTLLIEDRDCWVPLPRT